MNQNKAEIYVREDGKYDFRITAAENGNVLASSLQGYENLADCERTLLRLLNPGNTPIAYTIDEPVQAKHQRDQS